MNKKVIRSTASTALSRLTSEGRMHHEKFMQRCLALARRGIGSVSPNPLVGAVVVVKGKVVAEGYHQVFGGPHAEVECLRNFSGSASQATLYVNLEPCAHTGKTPPCTDLIIQRGIKNVVVGMKDPNPLVAGKGIAALQRAGVRVTLGILEKEAKELNRHFVLHIRRKMPYVNMKVAQSLDGFIAPESSSGLFYLTSKDARTLVHKWRSQYDAVLVGYGTIRKDDPLLTTRLVDGRDPQVAILDGRLRLTGKEKLFSVDSPRRIFVLTSRAAYGQATSQVMRLEKLGATVIPLSSRRGRIPLKAVLSRLYQERVGCLLVEGGADVFGQFMHQKLVDELNIFVAPILLHRGIPAFGSIKPVQQTRISSYKVRKVGDDLLLQVQIKE